MEHTEHHQPGLITPKFVFLHLLMIAMLYISVIAIITLYFQYVNYAFFDAVTDYRVSILNSIRWASSVLIVAYPVLVYVTYVLYKDMRAMPDQHHVWLRRWLLYFTQFLTLITIIVDVMVLVYQFYGGELTLRFGIKILAVLVVTSIVLGYYRWDLRRKSMTSAVPKVVAIVLGIILAISLAASFMVTGSPFEQRAMRFDEQRINDLALLQNSVLRFTDIRDNLPKDLAALREWSGELPADPDTETDYVYEKRSELSFSLCATFSAESTEEGEQYVYDRANTSIIGGSSWDHPAGDYCFERTIETNPLKQ